MIVLVKIYNEKDKGDINKIYHGAKNVNGDFNVSGEKGKGFTLSKESVREATQQEIDWNKKGADRIPRFEKEDLVQAILVPGEETFRNNASLNLADKEQTSKGKVVQIVWNNEQKKYKYLTDFGWWFVGENLSLIIREKKNA